jgi:LAO/AO transport system kinase
VRSQPLDRRALGKALSRLANGGAGDDSDAGAPPGAPARRIGVTGAPGAGKSTLVGLLATLRAKRGRIGVIAIDPSSPKSGGAILGDRIRMDELPGVSEIFIRSLGSRATSDGLADNIAQILDAMDRHGFDEVMLETVGVGQAEFAARSQVDTLILVLLPESGDMVQAMKAGVAEMADVVVVNKADLPGAQKMANDVRRVATLHRHDAGDWVPPVLLTAQAQTETIEALSSAIDQHQAWLATSPGLDQKRVERSRYRLRRALELRIAKVLARQDAAFFAAPLDAQIEAALRMLGRVEQSQPESFEDIVTRG